MSETKSGGKIVGHSENFCCHSEIFLIFLIFLIFFFEKSNKINNNNNKKLFLETINFF